MSEARCANVSATTPWGAPRDAGTAVNGAWPSRLATTRGFTDHEMLTGVQLVHMNGRVYDPKLGRFLSPDPLVNSADGTQAYNRYAYVRNNPLSVTDPTGLTGEDVVTMPKFDVRGDRVNSDLSLGNWRNTGILLGLQPYTRAGLTNGATLPSFSQAHFNYLEPQSIMSDGDPNDARFWGHLLALDAIMQYWDEKENTTGWRVGRLLSCSGTAVSERGGERLRAQISQTRQLQGVAEQQAAALKVSAITENPLV